MHVAYGLHPFQTSKTSGPAQEIRDMNRRSRTHTIFLIVRILYQDDLVVVVLICIQRVGIFY